MLVRVAVLANAVQKAVQKNEFSNVNRLPNPILCVLRALCGSTPGLPVNGYEKGNAKTQGCRDTNLFLRVSASLR